MKCKFHQLWNAISWYGFFLLSSFISYGMSIYWYGFLLSRLKLMLAKTLSDLTKHKKQYLLHIISAFERFAGETSRLKL